MVTGLRTQAIGDFISNIFSGAKYELIIHVQSTNSFFVQDKPYNIIVGNIDTKEINNTMELLAKSGPYDIIIYNLHDPKLVSGSILNINNTLNIKNHIEFINKIKQYVKPSGKIVNLITKLDEFSGSKTLDYDIGYFLKSQSIENYKNSIGFTMIKFPELSSDTSHFLSVFEFILQNSSFVKFCGISTFE